MKLLEAARAVVRWMSIVLLALLIATPLLQIVMRGIFNVPMSGAEELTRYFLICLVFIASSWVTQQGGQIRMEEMQAMIPPKPRWLVQLAIDISGIALFANAKNRKWQMTRRDTNLTRPEHKNAYLSNIP